MREIKFRIWHQDKMWHMQDGKTRAYYVFDNVRWLNPNNFEFKDMKVMQYVGLKDKNGKEIYEGDIVKVGEELFQISWNDFVAGFYRIPLDLDIEKQLGKGDKGKLYFMQKVEVIGNIYQNPELLKGDK